MIDFECPHTQTVPLSSELTINRPSGLKRHARIASLFSCDKIFVFDPSAKSHKMIVPSTEDEASTPP